MQGKRRDLLWNRTIFFFWRREVFAELLVNCLKKGNDSDGKLAAEVTSLYFIQLGESNDELYQRFREVIMPTLRDETKSASLRASVRWEFKKTFFGFRFVFSVCWNDRRSLFHLEWRYECEWENFFVILTLNLIFFYSGDVRINENFGIHFQSILFECTRSRTDCFTYWSRTSHSCIRIVVFTLLDDAN